MSHVAWWDADPDEGVMQEHGFQVPLGEHWAVGARIAQAPAPIGSDAVILCAVGKGGALRPMQVCLWGQIGRTKVAKMVACADASEIVAVPIRSAEYVTVWKRPACGDHDPR